MSIASGGAKRARFKQAPSSSCRWDELAAEMRDSYGLRFDVLRGAYEREHQNYAFSQGWQGLLPAHLLRGSPKVPVDLIS